MRNDLVAGSGLSILIQFMYSIYLYTLEKPMPMKKFRVGELTQLK